MKTPVIVLTERNGLILKNSELMVVGGDPARLISSRKIELIPVGCRVPI